MGTALVVSPSVFFSFWFRSPRPRIFLPRPWRSLASRSNVSQALFRPHECFFLLPCTSLVGSASFRRFRHWSRPELLLSNPRPRSIDFRGGGQTGWLLSCCRGWERSDDARAMVKTRFCFLNTRVGRIGSATDGRSRKGGLDPRSERVGGDSLAPVVLRHEWSGWDGGGGDIDPLRRRGRMGAQKGGIRPQMRWRMPSFNAPLREPGPTTAGQGQHRNHDTSASRSEEMVASGPGHREGSNEGQCWRDKAIPNNGRRRRIGAEKVRLSTRPAREPTHARKGDCRKRLELPVQLLQMTFYTLYLKEIGLSAWK